MEGSFPPTFVINLARREDRRLHMRAQVERQGIQATFLDAVDGRVLTSEQRALYDRRKALAVYGAEMTDAEIACHLSHMGVHRRMLDEGIELALVLEDDVECDEGFAELVGAIARTSRAPWKVLRLESLKGTVVEASRPEARGVAVERFGDRTLSRIGTGVVGCGAYLIRREGAAAMLRYAQRPFMPIDQAMDRYWENGIAPYVLRPFPVRQSAAIASEIGRRKIVGREGLGARLLRRARRAFDGLNKRRYKLLDPAWRRLG